MASQAPLWKQVFDAVERPVGELSEQLTDSEFFADNMSRAVRSTAPFTRLLPGTVPQTPDEAVAWLGGQIDRGLHRTRNGLKVLTGFDEPPLATTPHTVVWERDRAQLRRYDSTQRRHETPLLMVMSLVSTSKLFDLRPHNSFIAYLLQAGFDVYLLDWGIADERDAGNDLSTYLDDYIVGAIAAIGDITDQQSGSEQVDVVGYCFGGDLALLHAASYPETVRRLCVMATPVEWSDLGALTAMTQDGRLEPHDLVDRTGNVPAATIKSGFALLKPTAEVAGYVSLLQHLDNDAFVDQFRSVGAWTDEHVPFPGACFADLTQALVRDNSLVEGTTPVGDRTVDLADVTAPTMCILAERDHICPPGAASPVVDLVGAEHTRLVTVPAGHVGLVLSRTASKITLPNIVEWLTCDTDELEMS